VYLDADAMDRTEAEVESALEINLRKKKATPDRVVANFTAVDRTC
jgi:hypothetical protein